MVDEFESRRTDYDELNFGKPPYDGGDIFFSSHKILVRLPGFAWDFYSQVCLYVSLFLCLLVVEGY